MLFKQLNSKKEAAAEEKRRPFIIQRLNSQALTYLGLPLDTQFVLKPSLQVCMCIFTYFAYFSLIYYIWTCVNEFR